jgi:hypothetical protein
MGVTSSIAATCGLGLAGIVGEKATAPARAALAASRRRQRRLSRGVRAGGERDWDEVERGVGDVRQLAAAGETLGAARDPAANVGQRGALADPAFERFDRRLGPLPLPGAEEFVDVFGDAADEHA